MGRAFPSVLLNSDVADNFLNVSFEFNTSKITHMFECFFFFFNKFKFDDLQ